jgi:methyl-accepting chemotaxis protein
VDDIVGTIAVAVDEQTSTTREIADVNESASEISNSSAQVRQSANELGHLAIELHINQ